jgi:hypothetical protein
LLIAESYAFENEIMIILSSLIRDHVW